MGGLQAPIVNWQVTGGDATAGFGAQRVLLIAQGAGTSTSKVLVEDVQATEAEALFGTNSMATMAFKRFKEHNRATVIDIVPLLEPVAGTTAQGGITTTGTATESKNLELSIGDDAFKVSVAIVVGDTGAVIATKIVSAITATTYPFTSAVHVTDTTLVLVNFAIKGEFANKLIIKVKTRIAGLVFGTTEFTGGTGVYDVTGVLTQLTKRYQTVIFDSAMSFDDVETWLEARVNVTNDVKGGIGISFRNDTIATGKAFADAKNSKTMTVFDNIDEMKINLIPLLASAELGAKRALRLTDGAVLGNLVLEAVEAYGGISKSSLPYHNTPMSYEQPANEIDILQLQDLNASGLSLIVPATSGTVLGSVVTLYKTDGAGIADSTFKYLNAVDTSLAIQEFLFSNSKSEFGQTRATGGDTVAGTAMTNAGGVKAYIVGLYADMVELALAQGGVEALKAFKSTLVVTLDSATGLYSVVAPTAIVSQFRGLNGVVPISYNF